MRQGLGTDCQDLCGEPMQGFDGLDKVFCAGIFERVVAQAAQGLDEEHDGGDAGPGDFGGVMQGPGGKADGGGAGDPGDGFLSQLEQRGVEGDGFDGPDAGPGDGAAFFGGEAVAGGLRFGQHPGKDLSVEVAEIEGALGAAHDGGNDAGEGF